jgi:hypothetical protein
VVGARGPDDRRPSRGQLGNLIVTRRIEPSVKIAALALAAALLAACGERAGPGAEPGPDSPIASTPGTPGPEPSAVPVSPRPGLADVQPRPWQSAEPVGPAELRVEFYGGIEECEGVDHVEVDERRRSIVVTVFVGQVRQAEACIEIAVLKAVTVPVDGPIGDRRIVDGSAGN